MERYFGIVKRVIKKRMLFFCMAVSCVLLLCSVSDAAEEKDPPLSGTVFFMAVQKSVERHAISFSWEAPDRAYYYVIYGAKCGNKNLYKRITAVKRTSYVQKNLKEGIYYKFFIAAFDKSGKMFGVSNALHIVTDGGKAGNYKKVVTAAGKGKVTLKKRGACYSLKGRAVPVSKKKKVSIHQKLRYWSSDTSVATVDKQGMIKAAGKGKCVVVVYAQNGVYQKISLTVNT